MAQKKTFTPPPHFFTGSSPMDNDPDFHVITTDHHWMRELGLSVFTTGTLANWWDKKDERGKYVNRELIEDDGSGSFETSFGLTYFGNPVSFSAWRRGIKSGAYEEYLIAGSNPEGKSLVDWNFKHEGRSYDLDDVKLSDFNHKKVLGYKDATTDITEDIDPSHTLGVISQVIALNDHVRHYSVFHDKSFDLWTQQEKARLELITDIKTSKEGYVAWSGEVPFNFGLADGTFQCSRSEWVEFKLFLFDDTTPRSPMRSVALAKPTMVLPPKDFLGRVYKSHTDGKSESHDNTDPTHNVVADLDLTFNEYTNSWEAGTTQILGKVVTEIKQAEPGKNTDTLEAMDIPAMLANKEDEAVPFKTGEVMPITMQNGNPMQWSPNYADSEDCRKDGQKKATVVAYNFDSHKSFPKDKLVMLNKIHGVWVPMDFGSGIDIEVKPSIFEGLWDFTYFATNAEFYFKDAEYKTIEPVEKEKGFHSSYYKDDPENDSTYPQAPHTIKYGYHQFSSFDFMDHAAGGTRGDKRSLATTQFSKDVYGNALPGKGLEINSHKTFPFFGCVFPDGYSDPGLDAYYSETRVNDVKSYGDVGNNRFFNNPTYGTDPDVQSVVDQYPFSEGTDLTKADSQGCTRQTGSARSAVLAGHLQTLSHVTSQVVPGSVLPQDVATNAECQVSMFSAVGDEPNSPENTSAIQLPADIGTHASPSGMDDAPGNEQKHGRPISDLKKLQSLDVVTGPALQAACADYFQSAYHFLYKGGNTKKSAFNFKPTRPNRIDFRPLKWETYAAFDDPDVVLDLDGTPLGWAGDQTLPDASEPIFKIVGDGRVSPGPYQDGLYGRRNASLYGHSQMEDGKCVASEISRSRESSPPGFVNEIYRTTVNGSETLDTQGGGHHFKVDEPHSDYYDYKPKGLMYNSDLEDLPMGLPPSVLPTDSKRFQQEIWDQDWMIPKDSFAGGAAAVGVIGAICTVSADQAINFITDNYLGEKSYMTDYNKSNEGEKHAGGSSLSSWITEREGGKVLQTFWNPSWGGTDLDYKSFNTTNLYVRIYQAWPRNQTIYDPRFFAVYHFNDGIGSEQTPVETQELPIVFHDGTNHENITVDIETTAVDFRVPSVEHGPITVSTPDGPFTKGIDTIDIDPASTKSIYANGAIADHTGATVAHLISKDYWNVDTRRRGKLLPFNYKQKTIGIPAISEAQSTDSNYVRVAFGVNDDGTEVEDTIGFLTPIPSRGTTVGKGIPLENNPSDPHPEGDESNGMKMVITSRGQGYLPQETLTTNVGNAEILIKSVGVNGAVHTFEVTDQGFDIDHSNFMSSGTFVYPGSKGASAVVTVPGGSEPTSVGTGFEAYFTNGEVCESLRTDEKPKIVTYADSMELSIKGDNSTGGQTGLDSNPHIGMTQGVRETSATITYPSEDGKYDLFLHFHNDISHTWAGDWNPKSHFLALHQFEQNIGLTINPY